MFLLGGHLRRLLCQTHRLELVSLGQRVLRGCVRSSLGTIHVEAETKNNFGAHLKKNIHAYYTYIIVHAKYLSHVASRIYYHKRSSPQ